MITLVANATGIPAANIAIVAYDVPIFQPEEGISLSASNIAQIILIALILGLLLIVVLTTFKKNKEEETPTETELSVDDLLTTTQEHQTVEDIDLEAKSEIRLMVEKFVDENPDASAMLLRNWLNEEWG